MEKISIQEDRTYLQNEFNYNLTYIKNRIPCCRGKMHRIFIPGMCALVTECKECQAPWNIIKTDRKHLILT